MIAKEKRKLLKLKFKQKQAMEKKNKRGWISSIFSSPFQSDEEYSTEINISSAEIKAMEKVQEEYYSDMMISHQIEEKRKFMQTKIGRLLKWVGTGVAIFCIFKFLQTIRNVFFITQQNSSNLDQNLNSILSALPNPMAPGIEQSAKNRQMYNDVVIQYISFFYVGILISLNVNSLFNNLLASLKKILMKEFSIKFSSNTTMIVFCFFMGVYFMSNVLLMSLNLKEKYRDCLDEILEKQLDYKTIKKLFDYIFLVSTICSVCILSFNRYVKS